MQSDIQLTCFLSDSEEDDESDYLTNFQEVLDLTNRVQTLEKQNWELQTEKEITG